MAQSKITGTVVDESGLGLPGVNVVVEGTTKGAMTNIDGYFEFTVDDVKSKSLVFSSMGYATQTISIGEMVNFKIIMKEDAVGLEEVVVTALGIKRDKKALGYAVTEVKSEKLAAGNSLNSVAANLTGKVAGVQVINSSAGPGASTRITIRGNSSMASNNQPLYVIDGVPVGDYTIGEAGAGQYGNENYGSGIADLNQDDIESLTVLKGANASALYGSRASNGVILITTKKGKVNAGIGVDYSFNYVGSTILDLPDFQNTYGHGTGGNLYTDLEEEVRKSSGSWGPKMEGQDFLYWTGETKKYKPQSGNIEDFFERGDYFIHTLSLHGGGERSTNYFSYTYKDNTGITPNNGLESHNVHYRGTVKLGSETSPMADMFSLDSKVTFLTQEVFGRQSQGAKVENNATYQLFRMPRSTILSTLEDVWDEENNAQRTYNSNASYPNNPYWVANNIIREDDKKHMTAFTKLNVDIIDGLTSFFRVGYDYISQSLRTVYPYGDLVKKEGTYSNRTYNNEEINLDFLATYSKDIEDFTVIANFGGSILYNENNSVGVIASKQIVVGPDVSADRAFFINNYEIKNPEEKLSEKKQLNSLYGTATVGYQDMVYLDFSARNDWSSTLPKDNRSYFYPSISISSLLNEVFNMDDKIFPYLKTRVGYAVVGKDAPLYSIDNYYTINSEGVLGYEKYKKNKDLKPETTSSLEFGLEFKLLDARVYGDVTYYDTESKDQIFEFAPSPTTGYDRIIDNAATITNKGIEVLIGGYPFRSKDFTWDISVNFAKNENELTEFYDDISEYVYYNGPSVKVVNQVGKSYGLILAKDYKYQDGKKVVDDKGQYVLSDNYKEMGSYLPDFTLGLSNSFTYKGLTISFLIDGLFGGKRFNRTEMELTSLGHTKTSLGKRSALVIPNTVYVDGDDNVVENKVSISPAQYYGSLPPSEYIVDATNIRLRQASISYVLPKNVIEKIPVINKLSVSLVGNNLFYFKNDIEGYDPLTSASTGNNGQGVLSYNSPTTRDIGFNIKVSF
jgi:TonB-linked SusC/RagA family outer membrane protein